METITIVRCQYCNHFLKQDGAWQFCDVCDVNYRYNGWGDLHIRWDRKINDWDVALNLYPHDNKTILTAFHSSYMDHSDQGHTHIELPYCMQNVNPDNCLDKMRLLLVFQ